MTLLKLATRAALLGLALAALPVRADVTLNLKDAEISTLIATVSEVTGKNFIVDSRVKGKVTVISSSPMSSDGLYETFLAVLAVNGFAAVPAGDTIKIIPETNARWEGSSYGGEAGGLAKDEIVTKVFPVQNVSATQLVPILRPMIPQWGHLGAYQPSNILIISDRAANVRRLEQLIRQMDQVGDREIESFRLENASAAEVVRILTSLTQQDKQADPSMRQTAIIADERSNSVLIGGDRSERQKYREIIRQLDQPVADGGATQVVYLRFATAENLAPILEGYAQQVSSTDGKSSTGGSAPAAAASSASSGGGRDGIRVLSDKDTNALIITAPPKAMRQIRDVIAQLDIQRSQVLVEAIIAEVSATTSNQLGVDWAIFNKERIAAAGILNPSTSQALSNAATALASGSSSSGNTTTAALSLLGLGATAAGGIINENGTSFALLLKALKGDGNTNILSTPTLLTMDNEEAKFSVGQEVPFLTGSFSNTGSTSGTVNPFQTIERKDVGLTLGVTPQINEGNVVKLKIDMESSSLTASSSSTLQQTTNKRTLTNTVVVETGEILVIGGLTDDRLTDSKNQVPFLGDIPLLGNLFKARATSKEKSNLMVFIRPTILRKQSDADYYTRKKYDSLRQAQIEAARITQTNRRETPVLLPFDKLMGDVPPAPPVAEQQVPPPAVAGQARPQPPAPPSN
ncbi:type II secretion system secretin GspD [Solimonas sp. SE-A11]|uniref:type II secretion system secretin GspD n=1 Tax=Solimonas sp. SE-A11 TaxID=3054954 RepID=UPI00259C89A4|nr:type II secretion system secretin GspD [Solimonas sp. SE-A11]MDM4770155.1 type II secretion system secretin GspD [Solimonas sp. SE-A11]